MADSSFSTYTHECESFSLGFLCLRKVKVHFIAVKICIVRGAYTLIEAECPMRTHNSLGVKKMCIILPFFYKTVYFFICAGGEPSLQDMQDNYYHFADKTNSVGNVLYHITWALNRRIMQQGSGLLVPTK